MRLSVCLIGVATFVLSPWAWAQGEELRADMRVDVPVAAGAGVVWIGSELLKPQLAPSKCHWCEGNGVDDAVRGALRWRNTTAADAASGVIGFGLAPAGALGMLALVENHDDALHRWPTDAVLVLEAATIAADVNQLVKFGVGRERPFVHALPESEKGAVAHPSDNNLSFYSGHTNWVFALAASSGTVATLRGYRWAPWVWGGGLTVAFTTGYLRIAADRHYFTDVIVGAALGSAFGFAIPYLFHSPRRDPTAPTFGFVPTQGGGMLVAQWLQ